MLHIKVFPDFFRLLLSLWVFFYCAHFNTCSKRIICFVSHSNRITQGHVINYVFGAYFLWCWLLKLFCILFIQFDQSYLHYFYYTLFFFAIWAVCFSRFSSWFDVLFVCAWRVWMRKNFIRLVEWNWIRMSLTDYVHTQFRTASIDLKFTTYTPSNKRQKKSSLSAFLKGWSHSSDVGAERRTQEIKRINDFSNKKNFSIKLNYKYIME